MESQLEQLEKMAKEKLGTKRTQKTVREVKKHVSVSKEKAIREKDWKDLCEFIEKHNFDTNNAEQEKDFDGIF